MELDDYRWSALARYHDATLENALVLLGLSRCPVHSHFDNRFQKIIGVRSSIRIMKEINYFCFNARKSLEIANVVDNTIMPTAHKTKLVLSGHPANILGHSAVIIDQSFMWILSRVIHSVTTMVQAKTKYLSSSVGRKYSEDRYKYFSFGSDRDASSAFPGSYVITTEQVHYVDIEDFIGCYVGFLSMKVEEAIKTLRSPTAVAKQQFE